ncbi:MAG: thioredoxin family protein [Chromatiales bacterium]|nr:thioredoxin family protein [Chromatiales bacterium]
MPITATLFTAPGCPHCSGVKAVLQQLIQEGTVDNLDVIDITQQPDLAEERGIRSVPLLEMGALTFTGEQSLKELRKWVVRISDPEALVDYYEKLLTDGELATAESMLQKNPETLASLLTLIMRDELPLQVRIGVVALFEGVVGKVQLQKLIPDLSGQLTHADYRIRVDIAHLLELTGSREAIAPLNKLLQDENSEVREIAAEAIETLEAI